jgi:EmrB/QacA subfamily drug resistance transporter
VSPHHFKVPQTPAEADPRRWLGFGVLLIANFMNLIDVTIVNVALPSLQKSLGADASQIEWVVAAYVLAFALGLLPFGRLGDIVGRKKMFLAGVAGFTLASALCGLAPNIEMLIAARVLQGFAGAMMTPQVLAIVQVTFPPQEKGMAFSFFGLCAGLASVAGPLVGGLLIGGDLWGLDWRPIFLVNIPFGIFALVAGAILITNIPGNSTLKNDYVGIAIFGIAILLLIFPLIEGRTYGWPLWAFAMVIASVVAMVAFYLWEQHREKQNQPQLLTAHLLRNGNFLLGAGVATLFFSGIPGLFLVIAIFLQSGFGMTPLESGLTTVPFSVGVLVISALSGKLGNNYLRRRLALGSIILAVGMLWLRLVIGGVTESIDHWWFAAPLGIAGMGLGIGISALFQTILSGIPPRDAGAGSGALQAFQQVGGALGVALMGEIFFTSLTSGFAASPASPHIPFVAAAENALIYQITIFLVVAALTPFLKGRDKASAGAHGPAPVIIEA